MKRFIACISLSIALLFSPQLPSVSAATAGAISAQQKSKKKTSRRGSAAGSRKAKANSAPKPQKQLRSAAEVKAEKQRTSREIKETSRKITLNTKETEQRLNQLAVLEGEIADCNVEIGKLSGNLQKINTRIAATSDSINALDKHLHTIRGQFVNAVRKTQAARRNIGALSFIFSSESFAQAYRRMRALRQFNHWREGKSKEITSVKQALDKRRQTLSGLKSQADKQLTALNSSKATLVNKQGETEALVDRLKREGGELQQIMARRQKEAASLDAELDRIIAEEARRQEEIRRKKEEAERHAREEQERKAREAEEARIAKLAREAEEARKAEAQRVEAEKKAQQARIAAEKQRKAEEEAATAEEKRVAREARKAAEAEEKRQKAEAEKAEKERIRAEKEAEKKAREEARRNAKNGKPVKHTGKNNGRGDMEEPSSAPAPKLPDHMAQGVSGIAAAAAVPPGVDFDAAKGKLPFPVQGSYTIVKGFGRQKHPTLPHVETNNSGIDIATARNAQVRSVFDGEVSAVFRPDGYNNVIVIRHGRFMTVYANLGSISVSTGQKVKAGQTLGTLFADPSNPSARSVLHFEIRNQRVKENPELWLRR